ncbi:MFS transporter [Piscinibacter sakaiensis]|uniref:Putative membrane protein n=1 Tax=Piscinibacter sakaiensis TaxID=1547922 RepID=A0A0K8P0G5_PISS1|nr:MFS transporter [Piscinibacter sakaiensis]GAP36123.1 putative membrane protein [Piscinibacter sakaiensis]
MNRSLLLLTVCQALFLTNNVTFIAINGLVGLSLAPAGWMATLPVMGYVVGGALASAPVARLQARWGRQRAFMAGLVVAAVSALGCAAAVALGSFWGVVAATVLAGFYNANAQLYRFAGPELVAPERKAQAISLVMAGGVIGAFTGPNLASATRGWLPVPFAGAYLALVGVALLGLAVMACIRFPAAGGGAGAAGGRPLREIARQPAFVVAVAAGALAYGVMNLLMAATPLAMDRCGLPFEDAALVLEWHVLGMFVPAFFTGHLIQRVGTLPVMAAGLVLNLACVGVALSGLELSRFLVALLLLGVGWNFLFTGATTLLTTTYRPEERTRAQGAMDFCVFSTMAFTSFASGALVTTQGWFLLNLGSLLPLALVGLALAWQASAGRRAAAPAA